MTDFEIAAYEACYIHAAAGDSIAAFAQFAMGRTAFDFLLEPSVQFENCIPGKSEVA